MTGILRQRSQPRTTRNCVQKFIIEIVHANSFILYFRFCTPEHQNQTHGGPRE
jgi:hypothetical protein